MALPVMALLLGGVATWSVPRYQHEGWVGLVPTTVLVLTGPILPPSPGSMTFSPGLAGPSGALASPLAPVSSVLSKQELSDALWLRLTGHELRDWQVQLLFGRIQHREVVIRAPQVWPAEVEIPFQLNPLTLLERGIDIRVNGLSMARPLYLPASKLSGRSIRCVVALFPLGGATPYVIGQDLPTLIRLPGEELLECIDLLDATEQLRAELAPHIAMVRGVPQIILHDRPDPKARVHLPFIAACILEVRSGDRVIGSGKYVAPWKQGTAVNWNEAPICWRANGQNSLLDGHITLRVRGDSGAAAKDFMLDPFVTPVPPCWTGKFTVPLAVKDAKSPK